MISCKLVLSFFLIEIEDMSAFWRLKIKLLKIAKLAIVSEIAEFIAFLPEHFHMICLLRILKVYKEILLEYLAPGYLYPSSPDV